MTLLLTPAAPATEPVLVTVDLDGVRTGGPAHHWTAPNTERGVLSTCLTRRSLPFGRGRPEAVERGPDLALVQLTRAAWTRWAHAAEDGSSPATPPGTVVGYRALGALRTPDRPDTGDTVRPGTDRPFRHLILIESECDAPDATGFNAWYDDIHLDDVLNSPGYRSAWRFEILAPTVGRARYLTVYEVHSTDIAATYAHRVRMREDELAAGRYDGAHGLVPFASDGFVEVAAP